MNIIFNNRKIEVEKGTRVNEILKDEIEESRNDILACVCNNEVKRLDYKIEDNTDIQLLDYTSQDGKKIYVRGLLYIMAKALYEIHKEALLTVNYQLSNSMYCKIDNMEITDELLNNIENKMKEIVQANLSIEKKEMSREDAIKFYEREKTLRGIVQLEDKEKETISLYYCEDYYNYFFGVIPINTGVFKLFKLEKYEQGFLIRYPSRKNPDYLQPLIESRKLMKALKDYDQIHRILDVHTIYKLNQEVLKDNATNCILVDEALHEKKIADIADDIAKRDSVKVVLIAGPSSSGKTTFAQRLGIQLKINGLNPVTLSVDNYFVEREQNPKDEQGNYDFECIEAIDLRLFNEHILKLLAGEEIEVPTFDFSVGHKQYTGKKMKLKQGEVLVIEGIHCLNDKLTNAISKNQKYKIYISDLTVLNMDYQNRISTTDTRLIRRIVRDYQFRNYSALHTLKMWYSVNRGEKKYIFPYQEEADSVFNSSLVYELGVLKDYAIPLLKQIDKNEPEYAEAKRLISILRYFKSIPIDKIPNNSLIREFVGGSIFEV